MKECKYSCVEKTRSLLLRFSWRGKKKGCDLHSLLGFQDKLDGFVPAHFFGWYLKVRMAHYTLRTLFLCSQSLTAAAFVVPSLGRITRLFLIHERTYQCAKSLFPLFFSVSCPCEATSFLSRALFHQQSPSSHRRDSSWGQINRELNSSSNRNAGMTFGSGVWGWQ